jgi:hypothetical protein
MWRALVLCFLLGVTPAQAVEEADKAAIRGVIERQIAAFKADDAAAAYAVAAPEIQRMFPVERFMAMVREGYKPSEPRRTRRLGPCRPSGSRMTRAWTGSQSMPWRSNPTVRGASLGARC